MLAALLTAVFRHLRVVIGSATTKSHRCGFHHLLNKVRVLFRHQKRQLDIQQAWHKKPKSGEAGQTVLDSLKCLKLCSQAATATQEIVQPSEGAWWRVLTCMPQKCEESANLSRVLVQLKFA